MKEEDEITVLTFPAASIHPTSDKVPETCAWGIDGMLEGGVTSICRFWTSAGQDLNWGFVFITLSPPAGAQLI